MVPEQADDLCLDLSLKFENRVHAGSGVGTAVDVVAQEHDGVTSRHLVPNLDENVVQGLTIAVDIADRNGSHVLVAMCMMRSGPTLAL